MFYVFQLFNADKFKEEDDFLSFLGPWIHMANFNGKRQADKFPVQESQIEAIIDIGEVMKRLSNLLLDSKDYF